MRGKGSIANKGKLVDKLSGRCIMALMTTCMDVHCLLITFCTNLTKCKMVLGQSASLSQYQPNTSRSSTVTFCYYM